MKVVLDESVCLRLAEALRADGHDVVSIAETAQKGIPDDEVWETTCRDKALLITRDYHFTNAIRFDPALCLGILFIRHGNLTGDKEIELVRGFLKSHGLDDFAGRLVSVSPYEVRLR